LDHKRINPPTLFESGPFGFSQVVVSRGETVVHCSGQTAWNSQRDLVGNGDFGIQARESFRNLGLALSAAGARPADVVRIRLYVVDHTPEYLPIIAETVIAFFGVDHLPASTLLGVNSLALPDFLIEVDATAVIASKRRKGRLRARLD
jgi:enamine deaminase RidA (YjgF/YER057c/UK114 family)